MRKLFLVAAGLVASIGCANPCQQVCDRMATYADECGLSVPESEVDACVDLYKSPAKEDTELCRDFGDLDTIRRQWSCEDLEDYWGAGGGTAR